MSAAVTVLPTLFFIIWFGIALCNLINPRWIWRVTQSWKAFREPPPSYFMLQRIWATVMIAFGIVFFSFIHNGFLR